LDSESLKGLSLGREEAISDLARWYFRWIGPASVAEFQWFSRVGAKAAKAAVEPLGLMPATAGDARRMYPEDREALETFHRPSKPNYSLVSSLDGISHLRRDVKGLVNDDDQIPASLGGLTDLPSHAIVDRGRLAGPWEYDTTTDTIAWMVFGKKDKAVEAAVKRTEEFIRGQLGDARSFSLDSPKSRAPGIAALRAGVS
jgi:winged helix DNA-binding protein